MTTVQGNVALLHDPIAKELLESRQSARLAYTWYDGTPRVVPIWFHWTGTAITFGTPPTAPKVKVLQKRPDVAITIDDSASWPFHVLLVRGRAAIDFVDDVSPEYAQSAVRYLGAEQGQALLQGMRGQPTARIAVVPTWVAILDFETRFPSAYPS